MAQKQVALGTIVKIGTGAADALETQNILGELTPVGNSRALIQADALEDELSVPLLGIEEASQMTFTQFWEPGDTLHEKVDALFASQAEKPVQITWPSTLGTREFDGQVVAVTPQSLSASGAITRQVTIQRTSDITDT